MRKCWKVMHSAPAHVNYWLRILRGGPLCIRTTCVAHPRATENLTITRLALIAGDFNSAKLTLSSNLQQCEIMLCLHLMAGGFNFANYTLASTVHSCENMLWIPLIAGGLNFTKYSMSWELRVTLRVEEVIRGYGCYGWKFDRWRSRPRTCCGC